MAVGVFTVAIGMVGPTLLRHGTAEQQQRYLTAMLRGDELWCQLFSEPEAGSDLANISHPGRARRRRVGGHRPEGVDSARPSAPSGASSWPAPTPTRPSTRASPTSCVDMATPGIEIRPLRQMTGDAHFSEVFLDEVRIPAANVVGEVGDGWRVAPDHPGQRAHRHRRRLRRRRPARRSSRWPRSSGRAGDPLVRQAVVDAHLRSELLRFLRLPVPDRAVARARRPGPETSVMKLVYAPSTCSR